MEYMALYRKYRPQGFSSLVGQNHIRSAISNALLSNRLAHAYLFAGPRGTGKTSAAKIMAKAVNCAEGPTPEPCNACMNCQRINKDASMDVFEINAASNRNIDMIRDLQENICFSPVEGRKRVYIVDEAHMLTSEAFNALLKTLEEPPEHVLFILATTEPHKVPPTILSRCQRYDFRRLSVPDMIGRLNEVLQDSGIKATPGALALIAGQADGGMRDALSLLDQCAVMAEKEVNEETLRLLLGSVRREELRALAGAVGRRDGRRALEAFSALLSGGADVRQLLAELGEYFRALMLHSLYQGQERPPVFSDIYLADSPESLNELAALFNWEQLAAAGKRLHEAAGELRLSFQPRITAELCLLELCRLQDTLERENVAMRLEKLENMLQEGKWTGASGQSPEKPADARMPPDAPAAGRENPPLKAAVPKAAAPAALGTAPASPPPAAAETAGGLPAAQEQTAEGVWEETLRQLIGRKKGSLYAYALKGRAAEFTGDRLRVEFGDSHFLQKLKKDEYLKLLEEIISGITGRPTALEIAGGAPIKGALADGEQEPPPSDFARAETEELPAAVKDALDVFGGKLCKKNG
ncbi:MAG: DNA polymerase III subunit gamma/tau [Acidaminococcales bacterium]|jgi:DNA polymerase-3 subunit gamma/tau|nr:DNA polymerase III subunit gamma/tau [Acidaminococcales bacterium]